MGGSIRAIRNTRFNTALEDADPEKFYSQYWGPVAELFREDRPNAKSVNKALSWLLSVETDNRPVLVIDLSREQAHGLFWNERIQSLVINRTWAGIPIPQTTGRVSRPCTWPLSVVQRFSFRFRRCQSAVFIYDYWTRKPSFVLRDTSFLQRIQHS